jgi:hypothetical protein
LAAASHACDDIRRPHLKVLGVEIPSALLARADEVIG